MVTHARLIEPAAFGVTDGQPAVALAIKNNNLAYDSLPHDGDLTLRR